MKFIVSLKNPDVFDDAIQEAVRKDVTELPLSAHDKEIVREFRQEAVGEFIEKWVEYGEYIRIEFDTEAGTARVLEVKE